jgi:selenide, water dikinase
MPIDKLSPEVIGAILRGGETACAEAGIPVAGGHTIDSAEPIYGLAVMGLVHPDKLKRNAGAKAGDQLVLGKPLGVGVLSAALKKNLLDAPGYEVMLACTTRLNKPGPALAELSGVHAMTDVTGFGLLGHTLEMARGAGLDAHMSMQCIPLLPGVARLAEAGCLTGASARNWAGFGTAVTLENGITPLQQALLTDPQTAGGLLVACAPDTLPEVLNLFVKLGFADAAVVGSMQAGSGRVWVHP